MALFQGFNVKIPPYHQGSLCPQRRYCGLFILYVEENPLCSGGNSGNLPRNNPTTLHRLKVSTELLVIHGGSVVMAGNGNWVGSGSMDQITVVRIGDTHIAGEELHVEGKVKGGVPEYQNMEYSMPTEDEGVAVEEEEEDSVYVIEYSNPEEEGESYQFTMSVDRSLPTKRQIVKDPLVREDSRARVPSRPKRLSQSMKLLAEEGVKQEQVVSNKSVLELGEDYRNVMEINSGSVAVQLPRNQDFENFVIIFIAEAQTHLSFLKTDSRSLSLGLGMFLDFVQLFSVIIHALRFRAVEMFCLVPNRSHDRATRGFRI
ncbi:uncharacterized protein LOC124995384 isoform X2 [Mugil cephalus]|uniref:uncharacterized protein LOC124995384 isoform X2 n=1 Tax=Mugil cephalus TaxID=48193 RepID=UPI001FB617E9|nr:uncharacterized protein LOC124995384 isoform X2 [Mugil cephalus]